ncbi:MAG: host specificity factor TipJ family phage tail protein, partial [Pseudomonadota bacterium]
MRIKPYLIGKFMVTNGDSQTLNLLYGVADHAVDSISDIEINANPATFYSNVQIETRLGALDQTVIPYFGDTFSEKSVGKQLSTSFQTERASGNANQGLIVGIECPNGLYYANDEGGLSTNSVNIVVQYRKVGDATWSGLASETISGASQNAIRKTYRVDNIPSGEYDVQARFTAQPATGSRFMSNCYFTYIQGITYDDFTHPGASLLAIQALATDELSGGMPEVSCLVTRSTVQVHNGTDWVAKPATSPAWISYDMHTENEYGIGFPYVRMIYSDFVSWAAMCTSLGITANIYCDTAQSLAMSLRNLGVLGRGRTVFKGTRIGCVFDAVAGRTQIFNMENIVSGSFSDFYTETKDRANAIEVTFYDEDLKNQRQTLLFRDSELGPDDEERMASLALYACTNREIATKHAAYQLALNKYLIRLVSFAVDVDAIACQVSDVIGVSHDMPEWGLSARALSATANTITLNRGITFSETESYQIMVRHQDDDSIQTIGVANPGAVTTDTVTVTEPWATNGKIPEKDAVCSIGTLINTLKDFKILDISRNDNQSRRLTAIEYRPEVYAATITPPVLETPVTVTMVADLTATEQWREQGNSGAAVVALSWHGTAFTWSIFHKVAGGTQWIKDGETFSPRFDVRYLEPGKTYIFCVSGTSSPSDDDTATSKTATIDFTGWDNPARLISDVSGLQVYGQTNDLNFYTADLRVQWDRMVDTWETAAEAEIYGAGTFKPITYLPLYRVQICNPDNSVRRERFTVDPEFIYTKADNTADGGANGASNQVKVKVWARDLNAQESNNAAVITCTNSAPSTPGSFSNDQFIRGVRFWWAPNTEVDLSHYMLRSKVGTGSFTAFQDIGRRAEFIRFLTDAETTAYGLTPQIYIEVKSVDTFGGESAVGAYNAEAGSLSIKAA